jgi:hypothetical protein
MLACTRLAATSQEGSPGTTDLFLLQPDGWTSLLMILPVALDHTVLGPEACLVLPVELWTHRVLCFGTGPGTLLTPQQQRQCNCNRSLTC